MILNRDIDYIYSNPVTREQSIVRFVGVEESMNGNAYVFKDDNNRFIRLIEARVVNDIKESNPVIPEPEPTTEAQFHVLMFGGKYVDVERLHENIQYVPIPKLLSGDDSKESYQKRMTDLLMQFNPNAVQKFNDNIILCEFVPVELKYL